MTRFVYLLCLSSVLGLLAWSQGFTASVAGSVSDATGAIVPGAVVTVLNKDTDQRQTVTTDARGNFTASLLPPGVYSVTVEAPGFKRTIREAITLQVNQREIIDFKLEVGQVTESLDVQDEAPQIQAETATVGTAVTKVQSTELPLNGRNFLQLNLLVPGAQAGVKNTTLSTQGGAIEVHGLRENSNYFWVDGIDNTTQAIGQYVVNPPTYTIQEFRVMSPTYDAEFGRTAGAQINVITRSGTNALHGDLYEFVRNSAFDAKNFFDGPGSIPAFRRNQFGVDAGGPIIKGRTFIFGAFEGLRQRQAQSASNVVPTTAMIGGNFSALGTTLRDPSGGVFAGNIIPASRINAIGAAIASYYPAPNGATTALGATLLVAPIAKLDDNTYVIRADQVVTQKNRINFRIASQRLDVLQPISQFGATTNIPGFGQIQNGTQFYTTGISDTHVFSPTVVSEVRAGWNRWALNYLQQGNDTNYIQKLGLQNSGPLSQAPIDYGFPLFNMGGQYSNLGPPTSYPQKGPFDTWFIAPTVSWVRGTHSMKFGGDFHHFASDFLFDSNTRGTFTFNGNWTGNSLADLLLGLPFQATVNVPRNGDTVFNLISKQTAFFFQDDWRVRRGLTVNFGMRYEYTWPTFDTKDRMSNFDLNTGQLLIAGQNGLGRTLYNGDPKVFGPRAGFSWDPRANGRWAIRGGYGLFYELPLINQFLSLRVNIPFYTGLLVNGNGNTITLNNTFNAAGAATPSVTGFAQDYKAGRVQQFSVGIQHAFTTNLVMDAGYVGTRGDRLYGTINYNQPVPAPGVIQSRRPFTSYANVNITAPAFSSQYDGLELRLERRFARGIHFLSSYTFSKSLDNASASNGLGNTSSLQNARDINAEWGPSVYDTRHRFVFSGVYELPIGPGKSFLGQLSGMPAQILGGWQANGILTINTGQPFNPVISIDNSNTGALADRPNLVGDPYASTANCQTRTPNCWVNSAAFALPSQYTFGTAGRNSVYGPGYKNLDFSLIKNFPFGEGRRVEFRAEAFNLFNHVNLDTPTNSITANATARTITGGNFGKIFTAEPSRQIQLGLRVVF